jgi:hypothetical protein
MTVELTGARAVVHGDCPTECCRYGDWTIGPTPVRDRPDSSAPVIETTSSGLAVHADSGLTIYDPFGLAVATRDVGLEGLEVAPRDGGLPVPGRLAVSSGDTLVLLSEGETGYMFLWRGKFGMELDPTESADKGVRLLRHQSERQWWAFVSSKSSSLRGWINVDRTEIAGADACGRT